MMRAKTYRGKGNPAICIDVIAEKSRKAKAVAGTLQVSRTLLLNWELLNIE